jgi:radial spoke head protein 4A
METRGTGVNEYVYWVCNCPSELQWTPLPDLSPEDLIAARNAKIHFTGDLDAQISFTYKKPERLFLRA